MASRRGEPKQSKGTSGRARAAQSATPRRGAVRTRSEAPSARALPAPARARAGGKPRGGAAGRLRLPGSQSPLEAFAARRDEGTLPLFVVGTADYASWLESAPPSLAGWLRGSGFKPRAGACALLPGPEGPLGAVVVVGEPTCPWDYGDLPVALAAGTYEVEPELAEDAASALALGWALGSYRFGRYVKRAAPLPRLVWPEGAPREQVLAVAEGAYLARDLINLPASDLGPAELAASVRALAAHHGGKYREVVGDALLRQNYPLIHAVGRASARAPRLAEFTWGRPGDPKLTLVGKGVCFDTGGLNLKPGQSMKLMKKDMGGAALVLGLAHAVLSARLRVRLRVLIPAVENSVSGDALRPLDVIRARSGLTVEIGDTDAEGRLILADALSDAVGEQPAVLLDVATLTGAARVALGTSIPAVFCNRSDTWAALETAAAATQDPLWRLPLYEPYRKKLDSSVADLSSVGDSFGGAITAALFLREFATLTSDWVHLDTMAYNLEPRPGRPRGGEALGLLALLHFVHARFGG
jgi:leucyl aminopeptidase